MNSFDLYDFILSQQIFTIFIPWVVYSVIYCLLQWRRDPPLQVHAETKDELGVTLLTHDLVWWLLWYVSVYPLKPDSEK